MHAKHKLSHIPYQCSSTLMAFITIGNDAGTATECLFFCNFLPASVHPTSLGLFPGCRRADLAGSTPGFDHQPQPCHAGHRHFQACPLAVEGTALPAICWATITGHGSRQNCTPHVQFNRGQNVRAPILVPMFTKISQLVWRLIPSQTMMTHFQNCPANAKHDAKASGISGHQLDMLQH